MEPDAKIPLVDLHTHTIFSDGAVEPKKIVEAACAAFMAKSDLQGTLITEKYWPRNPR